MNFPLVCPSCGEVFGDEERFCPRCGTPLVRADADEAPPLSARQERARKVKRQYTEGPLVKVARAHHQAEAELIQGLLLEEGIPSMTKRSMGFDIPDFMAAGPRDVLVPRSGADAAREVLQGGASEAASDGGEPREV
jgi:predicted  nucleic acid-binding Zn-ribbon protein